MRMPYNKSLSPAYGNSKKHTIWQPIPSLHFLKNHANNISYFFIGFKADKHETHLQIIPPQLNTWFAI